MNTNAIIILLYGTSTSGKTTICTNIQKHCNPVKVEGTDSAFKRLEDPNNQKLIELIKRNKDFLLLNKGKKIFSESEILNGVINEKIDIEHQKLSLMFDHDDNTFKVILDKFLKNLYLDNFSDIEQAIINLRKLAISCFDQTFIQVHEEMFDRAIDNSMKGIPSILDIVPHPAHGGQFMIDLFLTCLKKNNHTCPTHIALIHCPLHQLSERMNERNRSALESEDLENVRDKSFPFRQYAQLFGYRQNIKNDNLGKLKIKDARKAMKPFCVNSEEIDELIEKIGFKGQVEAIDICPKCKFDQIYDTEFYTSKEIAEKIYLIIKNISSNSAQRST